MNILLLPALCLVLLGATACASNRAAVPPSPERPVPGAVSVTSESELNSDNRPAVKRTGEGSNPDNAPGLSRGQVPSVYEIQK